VLNAINVGSDFLMLAQINNEEVIKVKKCNHHISLPITSPGIIIAAFANHAKNSIVL
jgi:hypothetical protein